MAAGDYSRVIADAVQVEAGATMLDVNAGMPMADEPAILPKRFSWCRMLLTCHWQLTVQLCWLESVWPFIKATLVNSVTGEEERLETVLPLVKKYNAAVVAISNDETGISEDPNVRYDVAKKIVERAADYGVPREDVVVDPLIMPVGAINMAGRSALDLVIRLRNELEVNTTCGASNISFGLPESPLHECRIFVNGRGGWHDIGHYEPIARRRNDRHHGANVMNGMIQNVAAGFKDSVNPLPLVKVGVSVGKPARRRNAR